MSYQHMADYYHFIFPSEQKVSFLESVFKGKKTLLDVGCADGGVSLGLSQRNFALTGIDIEEEMLRVAKTKAMESVFQVKKCSMEELNECFPEASFDGVFCIGNTVVHLLSEEELEQAIENFNYVLKKHGKLVIQILNYEQILEKKLEELPLIENEKVRFERRYSYQENLILFETALYIKEFESLQTERTYLYPFTREILVSVLQRKGFFVGELYGDFQGNPYQKNGLSLILVAEKIC